MPNYAYERKENAERKNVIHNESCGLLPDSQDREHIGLYPTKELAKEMAERNLPNREFDFCPQCCRD